MRTKTTIQIRLAANTDLEAICELSDQINAQHHAAAPTVFVQHNRRELDRLFWQTTFQGPTTCAFVACDEDEAVLGFITVSWQENNTIPFLQRRKICRIGTIVVADSHQHQGIGKLLMDAALAWGREQGAVEVRLEVFDFNRNAIEFYQTQGYQVQSHIMCKSLD
ncbi:GNAT family N-acetyltransferase [Undibacterium sp. TS12]|uniref:GNAT family N-acetyltransferase n=1 Tax=Undibacterium sp. TS12 TaxID=2908202 RepID=UPI001F4CED9D|nr:GNAT family N-acetyltransferase [Undibacterium sp. TS12]MCH8620201.1 GNAT family N-acetyltransferase [Undibacterium sp. TS12]